MSINVSVGVMIPVDVLEVGQEISADQLAAIQNASGASAANPLATKGNLLRGILSGSTTLDEGDNNYVFVLDNGEQLTINDDGTNNPPIGSVFTILFIGTTSGGQVSVDSGVTINGGSSSYVMNQICTKLLIKTAANTWWIG